MTIGISYSYHEDEPVHLNFRSTKSIFISFSDEISISEQYSHRLASYLELYCLPSSDLYGLIEQSLSLTNKS